MATTDIRFKRMDKEYLSVRQTQGEVFDKIDGFEGAVLGLNQAVAENRAMILENSRKLDALLKHLEVPYKPPAGFIKE